MEELRRLGAPDAEAEDRARLRALANEFPGALRELDTLPTDEIVRRATALESGAHEPWMDWLGDFHDLMRIALEVKRTLSKFREKGERRRMWLDIEEAARWIGEPGLVPIIEQLTR